MKRIENIDLIRATAIIIVVIYHSLGMVFAGSDFLEISEIGKYGVDLFFVLSGFLIGKLYWSEFKKNGNVNISRFIQRRIFRTIPLYLIALFFSYLPVLLIKHQSFDFVYLIFGQNFYQKIPFFSISWSLCVEEHFYIFLPFFLLFLNTQNEKTKLILLGLSTLVPMILRLILIPNYDPTIFGYATTATFFRFEGLILGIIASYLIVYKYTFVAKLKPYTGIIVTVNILWLILTIKLSSTFNYYFGLFIISVLFTALVLTLYQSDTYKISKNKFISLTAVSSYSIYLTHALVIHFILKVINLYKINLIFGWVLMLISVFIVGVVFYNLFEKNMLYIRDKFVPNK